MIFDSHVSLKESAEFERPEVDIPFPIVNFFQPDVLSDDGGGDIDPLTFPTNATIGTDVSHFEAIWIFKRR